MNALILAAGQGLRLRSITSGKPKCLIEIQGKSIIERQIEMFYNIGVKRIFIVVGYKKEAIINNLSKKFSNLVFIWNPFYQSCNVIGSAWLGLRSLPKNDGFYYVHADTIFEKEVLHRLKESTGNLALCVDKKVCGEEEMKIWRISKSKIKITKAIIDGKLVGEFIGLMKIDKAIINDLFNSTETVLNRDNGVKEFFETVVQNLTDEKKIRAEIVDISGLFWSEIDFPEDYNNACKSFRT